MAVGALLDATGSAEGAGLERLREALGLIELGGYRLDLERVKVGSLGALSMNSTRPF